jgi:SAM-dependent methyltransferase
MLSIGSKVRQFDTTDLTQTDSERIFSRIYQQGQWGTDDHGNATSGPGSRLENGKFFIFFVQEFLNQTPHIQSVVDIGCGDWVLAREIDWGDRKYLGIDVVKPLIQKNQSTFGSKKIHFVHLDVIHSDLPLANLVICKDVFIHLPNSSVWNLLVEFNKFEYCIVVNDVSSIHETQNRDILIGNFRPIDLTCFPFFLKPKMTAYYSYGTVIKQILLMQNNL